MGPLFTLNSMSGKYDVIPNILRLKKEILFLIFVYSDIQGSFFLFIFVENIGFVTLISLLNII